MSRYIKVTCCGECGWYDWKKHKCSRGAKDEGEAQDKFYKDCPLEYIEDAEKNNGWIPCSERLPEDDSICIITLEWPNEETEVTFGWFDKKRCCWYAGNYELKTSNVLAWQPLPEPYKAGDNNA